MPTCCIVTCGAYKNKNQPQLTLHSFPKKESLRKKWLDAIGEENINPRQKNWHVCSLHFEERCFNRTLDVIRLRDGSVPTIFSAPQRQGLSILCETSTSTLCENVVPHETIHKEVPQQQGVSALCESGNIKNLPCTSTALYQLQLSSEKVSNETTSKKVLETLKTLQEKCVKQKQKIKRLNEKVRKRNKKIAIMKDILEDLRRQNRINGEQAVLIEELAGPQDFLKRQITKSKGLPVPNKYSEEIRKFALTLHFLSPKAYHYVK